MANDAERAASAIDAAQRFGMGDTVFSALAVGQRFYMGGGSNPLRKETASGWYTDIESGRKYKTGKYSAVRLSN